MKLGPFLFLLVFLPVHISFGQAPACPDPAKAYYQWYFGQNEGLDFSSAVAPSVITDSKISGTDGVTSIADPNGKILFYSNGSTIWDSTNAIMQNGTGLSGDPSYSQSTLAVPMPGDPNKFYVFTNGASGVEYSVVDMTLNGGKGQVISKNNPLYVNTTEKLAAVADGNGGIWLVTSIKNSNEFMTVQILGTASATGFGLSGTQNAGTVQTSSSGTMKFSKDGTKVAVAMAGQSLVEVYDFNKTTGTLSATPVATINEAGVYDVEFSPDNSKLYTVNKSGNELAQFDLNAGTNAAIQTSKVVLSNASSTYYNSIKLGPDGKIYVGLGKLVDGISVIDSPNNAGALSNYQHDLIPLTSSAGNGFPNTVANYTLIPQINYKNTCERNTTEFTALAYGDPASWTWDFGDGSTATGANPKHVYPAPGAYNVTLTYPNSCGGTSTVTQSVTITPNTVNFSLKDTTVCITPYVLDPAFSGDSYLWSTGQTTSTLAVTNAGKYWVKITKGSCSDADTVEVKVWGQGNKGNYKWYFGSNAGLDFANNPPTVITTNADNTKGGTSSIADPQGNLLFYTDGINVYDKNNTIMQGGTGLNGTGDTSQSVLIVPHPGANNFYYVFTVNPTTGLSYSVVDLSYNGGIGKVTQTNIPLTSPVSSKIAGVKNDKGEFWVVSRKSNSNQFVAYKIDTTGLKSAPVISAVGTSETDGQGYLKFSEDGTKAAVAIEGSNTVEIYDFDKNTGIFSNPVTITNVNNPYGVEFSSSNNMLYVSTDGDGHIYQYDITSGNAATIMATKKQISNDATVSYEALQMGPDGRIYVALKGSGSGYLAVINNSDLDSANVGFQNRIISLGTQSNSGLPNFVANHFKSSDWGIQDQDTCFSLTTLFLASAPDTVYSWTWDFGEPSSASNTATGEQASHLYAAPGTYTVKVRALYPCGDTTLTKDVTIIPTPVPGIKDTTLCTATSYMLDAGNPGAAYLWNTGDDTQTITTDTSGIYSVTVDVGGCSVTGTANIVFAHINGVSLGNDTTLCAGSPLTLDPGAYPGGSFNWSTGATTQTISVSTSGNYYVDVTSYVYCKATDTVKVTFVPVPVANLGPDFPICQGTFKKIGAHNANATYIWSNNSTTDSIAVSAAGQYWLEVSTGGSCAVRDTVNVTVTVPPIVNLGNDQTLCSGITYTADAGNPTLSFLWSTSATTQTIPITSSGNYWVEVTDGPCKVKDDINITFITKPVVSFGPDQTLCQGDSKTLDAGNYPGYNYLWTDNTTGQQVTAKTTGAYGVKVYKGNCIGGDTVNLTFNPLPAVSLPAEVIFCSQNGETVQLNGGLGPYTFLWTPGGQTTSSITVLSEGIYSLEATDVIGCKNTASTNIKDICEALLFVPTIFSPNGDGKNDEFTIYGKSIVNYKLQIFDRWGELIFVSEDMNRSWDGRYRGEIVQEGAYIWKISYSGETVKGIETQEKTGDVTVIR